PGVSLGRVTTYQSVNTPGANVKLTGNATLVGDNTINGLIIDGDNIVLNQSGFFRLTIGTSMISGVVATRGGNSMIDVTVMDFQDAEPLFLVDSGSLNLLGA